ncbi:small GTP-binding protein domain [Histomonas meleagridis]|uniref:small GTP-binding protein domain n=1 Tax=Histomonas meleagridis TaxID=135588 RepID=UPI00355A9FC7|nr:small GTP-binding protein domain [Histomonas meleagridis]KAH0802853.1 small GTP-binding protein domain [Histomonas meleagridis]
MAIQLVEKEFPEDSYPSGLRDDFYYRFELEGNDVVFEPVYKSFWVDDDDDFIALTRSMVLTSRGFLIVYSIDSRYSFELVEMCYKKIISIKNPLENESIPIAICGNKSDLTNKRVVSETEGRDLAARLNVPFFETSALNNINIKESFCTVAEMVYQKWKKEPKKEPKKEQKSKNTKEVCTTS